VTVIVKLGDFLRGMIKPKYYSEDIIILDRVKIKKTLMISKSVKKLEPPSLMIILLNMLLKVTIPLKYLSWSNTETILKQISSL
jgi:hypothetical protein